MASLTIRFSRERFLGFPLLSQKADGDGRKNKEGKNLYGGGPVGTGPTPNSYWGPPSGRSR